MRNPPDMSSDPYRTLGLQPGASMAEVKRAYRLLAKAFHPDSAGEAALPRFLAIHEAYERLKSGRPVTGARPTRGAAPAAEPWRAEPWRADPDRARAARERARTNRSGRASAGGAPGTSARPAGAGSTGAGRPSGPSASSGSPGTSAGPAGSASSGPAGASSSSTGGAGGTAGFGRARGGGRRRETRKATMGSTSYDDARDPSDATWSGASWYGPTTGEYWIVNPREYADPRKHGPDYQSRARRPFGGEETAQEPGVEDLASVAGDPSDSPTDPLEDSRPGGPRATSGRGAGAAADAGADAGADADPDADPDAGAGPGARRWAGAAANPSWDASGGAADARPRPGVRWDRPGEAAADPRWRPPIAVTTRDWLGGPADDPIRRLGTALVAWPPLGLAAAAAIGEITGCSLYSAECGGTEPLLPWLAQAGILGLLLLLPPVARLLAGGTIAVLLALVPVTGFLVVVGAAGAPQAGFALAFLLALVWLAGVGWSVVMARRRGSPARGGVAS